MDKKQIISSIIIVIILTSLILVGDKLDITGNNINRKSIQQNTQQVKIVPLSVVEKQRIENTIVSSEFIKDMPENEVIALRFFNFINGERIWQDEFLITKNQLLSQGNPSIYLTLHSKYIPELNQDNLCEVISKANKNGDLGFDSKYSKARLLLKFATMLKYRSCLGF